MAIFVFFENLNHKDLHEKIYPWLPCLRDTRFGNGRQSDYTPCENHLRRGKCHPYG